MDWKDSSERALQLVDIFAIEKVIEQLERMDFTNYGCSPLINGGCGLGKTTALTSDLVYNLFKRKLNKEYPRILIVESRSATRDQLRQRIKNPNYTVVQFSVSAILDFDKYDILIIDEAHSLFGDAEFATEQLYGLGKALRSAHCFQIFITATDLRFLRCAEMYFDKREFELTFPDTSNLYLRFIPKRATISVSTQKISKIIDSKKNIFFKEGTKGIFFTLSAADAHNLCERYSELGYRCAFYVSKFNRTVLSHWEQEAMGEDDDEEENRTLAEWQKTQVVVNVNRHMCAEEQRRKNLGLPTVRESLLSGKLPDDIDYLFITPTGQEGLDISNCNLDFIFVEDAYPDTTLQKIFRYRGNLDYVYVSLPRRRIEKMLNNSVKELEELISFSQETLRAIYKERKRVREFTPIVYDKEKNLYLVSPEYRANLLVRAQEVAAMRQHINDREWIKSVYSGLALEVGFEDYKEVERENILRDFFRDKIGMAATKEMRDQWVEELKQLGLRDGQYKQNFNFPYVKKVCEELKICLFKSTKVNKKDCEKNSSLKIREKCLRVEWLS